MPFGIKNSLETLQRALDVILSALKWEKCIVYLEDFVIFSKNADEHIRDVDDVMIAMKRAGIALNI